jgi:hypothetical protein
MNSRKEESLAYIFDPIRKTYIDDEDQSLGNKLALSEDVEEIIKQIDDQFGPGTVFPASELSPKENPYKDFEDGNPAANGGMMRQNFDAGGVAQVRAYVEGLPKNSVVTRKLIQDFIDANNVNVNFENLFNKQRSSYVGNFVKDKSIKVDQSYAASFGDTKKYKKAKDILNDPKTKKEFIKFGNKEGVSVLDIRNKYKLNMEEFYYGGLRELFDKDFQKQSASKIKTRTINNIKTLLNDKEAFSFLKRGEIVPDNVLTKLNLNPSEAATATVRIGQIYGGNNFGVDEFKKIRKNIKASDKLFNTMNKFPFGNPYRGKLYKASLELIDQQLGNQKGTFESLKKKASYILKKNKIKGFDINEIAGVSGTAKTGVGEFSQFIDVLDSKLNQKEGAAFQSAFSQARQNIANNPASFATEAKRINKLASNFESKYGFKLPRVRNLEDVQKYYSPKRLEELKKQGLDIEKASKKLGYTIEMPKGAVTIQEFIEKPELQEKLLSAVGKGSKLKEKLLSTVGKGAKLFGKVIKPVGYAIGTGAVLTAKAMSDEMGIKLSPLDYFVALDSGDPDLAIRTYKMRTDPEYAKLEEAKTLSIPLDEGTYDVMNDQMNVPNIDETTAKPLYDYATGGRVGFDGGGAVGADDDFAKELEYYFTNPDSKLPEMQTFKETMNPITYLNDMIDPRNYPYYADILARSGVRVAEFGARILPALGQLASDLIQKPAFKVVDADSDYVQDYNLPGGNLFVDEFDMMDTGQKKTLQGTGIFSKFLENITPTSMEKKLGLDKLIEGEKQKMIDRGSTAAPVALGETVGLGVELAAPIFPGVKFFQSYAKARNLPADDVTKQIMEKEIDEVLSAKGTDRREFLKVSGAGGAVILAKMLGFGDDFGRVAKVAEKAVVKTPPTVGKPEWFDALVNKVILEGDNITKQLSTVEREIVHSKKLNENETVTVYQDLNDGNIRVEYDSPTNMGQGTVVMEYKPGVADETTGGAKPRDTFETVEPEPQYSGDTDIEMLGESGGPGIEFLESDVSNLKEFATGTKLSKEELEKRAKRVNLTTKVTEDNYEAAEFLGGKYGDGPEPPDDWNPGDY